MRLDARVVVFDLDDTLAVSKGKITPRMANCLTSLLAEAEVCIISGGRYEQFQTQVLEELPVEPDLFKRLHLMPTCGTRYLRWADNDWHEVYAEYLTEAEKTRIAATLTEGAKFLGLWETKTWGEIIEDRGSQVTFSALGQRAPIEAKTAWDQDGSRKRALQQYVSARLPELEVRGGGSTSIDVTRKGIDKAHGIKQLVEQVNVGLDDLLFIGDRLDEGGNDYPVRALGVRCVSVEGWEETAGYVEWLLGASEGYRPLAP
jgi:hypothetical protein